MRMIIALGGVGALLVGCAMTPQVPPSPGAGPGQCDAATAQSLVGTHVGAVSFPAGANVRIVCTTCPTTRDYRPDRLNVRFEETTGIIRSVDCG